MGANGGKVRGKCEESWGKLRKREDLGARGSFQKSRKPIENDKIQGGFREIGVS